MKYQKTDNNNQIITYLAYYRIFQLCFDEALIKASIPLTKSNLINFIKLNNRHEEFSVQQATIENIFIKFTGVE